MPGTPDKLDLDRIMFIGRTFSEYLRMFDLDEALLRRGRVLDCPAGASSFTAEARAAGFNAVAADALFDLQPETLMEKGRADLDHVLERVRFVPHLYVWDEFGGIEDLRQARIKALSAFANDFPAGRTGGHYRKVLLPELPFADGEFSLLLSGHFLFTYGDRLDFDFHVASLQEMLRVSSEVRVFPLVGLDVRPYNRLGDVMSALEAARYRTEIRKVPYEFQRGSNHMLRLYH